MANVAKAHVFSTTSGEYAAYNEAGSSTLGKVIGAAKSAMGLQTEEEKKKADIEAKFAAAKAKRKQEEEDEKKKRKEKMREMKQNAEFKKLGLLVDGKPLDDEKVNKQGSTSKDDGTKLEELD